MSEFASIKGWEKRVGFSAPPARDAWERANEVLLPGIHAQTLLHDVEFPCFRDGLRPALHLELAVDRVDIPFHSTYGNNQLGSNLSIGVARDDEPQYLQLAFAQWFT